MSAGALTENKRVNLAPELLVEDLKRLKVETEINGEFPFALIGRRHLRDNSSWLHNSERLMKGKNRCTMWISAADAANLKIEDGQPIKVSSRVGAVEIPCEISDKIMPGVVSIPHGYGHSRRGIRLETAQSHAGVSLNDLTDERVLDDLTGNAAFSSVKVRLETL